MNNSIHQNELQKKDSPAILSDYIRVSTPGIWLLLVALILFLAGVGIWACLGEINQTVHCHVHVEENLAECTIYNEQLENVKIGMLVEFNDMQGEIDSIVKKDEHVYSCILSVSEDIPDGVYEGDIIIEKIKPIGLLIN